MQARLFGWQIPRHELPHEGKPDEAAIPHKGCDARRPRAAILGFVTPATPPHANDRRDEQAAVLHRLANLERENIELVALRDSLRQQVDLREKLRIFNSNDPTRIRKKGGIPWLWIVAGFLVLYTWSCGSNARIDAASREAAGQL